MSACPDLHLCHPHCVHLLGSALQGENSRRVGGGAAGKGPVVCGGGSDRELTLLPADGPWILDIAAGFRHVSPSLPWVPTSKKLTLCQRSQLEYFLALLELLFCFLFWLCFLMIKAAFDTSAALNVHLSFLLAHPSLDPSLNISASSCYVCAFSYPTTVSLLQITFNSTPTLFLCRLPKGSIICHLLLPFFLLVYFLTLIASSTPKTPNCTCLLASPPSCWPQLCSEAPTMTSSQHSS